ncbi:MAG: TldD/PmbA family protein [Candidatus Aminicenantales bacterium]
MNNKKQPSSLIDTAEYLVNYAQSKGADESQVSIAEGLEFSVDVRLGKIENLVEAGLTSLAIKVIKDKKTAWATSSDLSLETLKQLVVNAIARAQLANPDPFAGLPDPSPLSIEASSLKLYDPEIPRLETKTKISAAKQAEKIALTDKRITNSHGANLETREIKNVLANSFGFLRQYDETFCSLSLGLQAGETGAIVEDFWFSAQRFWKDMESPAEIAKKAVERTVRQLNPRKIKTQKVPVIFEPMMTSWLLGFLFACISGVSIYQKASFLVGKLHQKIAAKKVNVYNDGLLPGKLGSRPFDSEGIPSQKTAVIEKGILKNYLCNSYAARKLKLKSTGNAEGTGVSPNNFYLAPGDNLPQNIISSLEKGLILIRTIGHGLNPLTGEISKGAYGLWVEKGEVKFPVSEITISGQLGEILNNIEIIGNDLDWRSPLAGPTIKIKELMIAGE